MAVFMILRKRKMTFKSKWWIIQFSIFAVLIFLLSACAYTPTAKDLANADYGSYPDNYMQSLKNYGKGFLKDPPSARWNFNYLPREMWLKYWGGIRYGYGVCTEINTRTNLGVYTGFRTHFFLIKNGRVVQHIYDSGKKEDRAFLQNRCGGY
jgi:hypothetical protein